MRWVDIDTSTLAPDAGETWAAGRAANEGAVVTDGTHTALIGPSDAVGTWLSERYRPDAALVTELAGFVYHRKGWFAPGSDPLALRDRRVGQYDLRVFTEVDGGVVPLFAIDFAPMHHAGTFATLDQRTVNGASSLTEIARVPADQPVRIAGRTRSLGSLACGTSRLWEASRLGSISELVRLSPTTAEDRHDAGRRLAHTVGAFSAIGADRANGAQAAGRALFGVALAWAIARLPIDLIVGLSQGNVVRVFTALVTGGDRHYSPLVLDAWHDDAPAFRYAPGYFATGAVQGYSLDAVHMRDDALEVGLRRLARLAPAGSAASR